MCYFIDTNIFLFFIREKDRLSKNVFDILTDYENIIYLSSESIKEIIHLLRIGKIEMPIWKTPKDIFNHINKLGFSRPQRPC
jgi:PIN domain nuclease of toxin-antitoxin system